MKHDAIYAGTFDPITLGHLDIVERAAEIFDHVLVAVVERSSKNVTFTAAERVEMVREAVKHIKGVEVTSFDGLLVNFARENNIYVLIRGLRAYSDFEYEFQMALTNRKLAPDVETLFLMPKETHSYVSSSVVGEVASHGGEIGDFVPHCVLKHIKRFLKKRGNGSGCEGAASGE